MSQAVREWKEKGFLSRSERAGENGAWQVNDVFLNRNAAAVNGRAAPNCRLQSGPAAGPASANQITNILINSESRAQHAAAEMKDARFPFFFFPSSFVFFLPSGR